MTLRETCHAFAPLMPPLMHNGEPCDPTLVLWAFAGVESSYGRDREKTRFEPAYSPGGSVYRQSRIQRDLWRIFGPAAAQSFGTWQMLYPTAHDLGFTQAPEALKIDTLLAPLVCQFMARCQGGTLENAADAYNSGNWRDQVRPFEYIARIVAAYGAGWSAGPA